jgi:transcriptional regulator of acetoin/glycerol metabolism
MDLLRRHTWPGNVRELQNVLERAGMNTDEHRLEVSDFQGLVKISTKAESSDPSTHSGTTYADTMAEAERRILESALSACNGRVVEAARSLGIGRATFYKRMAALHSLSPNRDLSPTGDTSTKILSR